MSNLEFAIVMFFFLPAYTVAVFLLIAAVRGLKFPHFSKAGMTEDLDPPLRLSERRKRFYRVSS